MFLAATEFTHGIRTQIIQLDYKQKYLNYVKYELKVKRNYQKFSTKNANIDCFNFASEYLVQFCG